MKLAIEGLSELRARLARLRPDDILATTLATEAERLAQTVRDSLAEPQGSGDHDQPWRRTGALHDSIQSTASGLEAAIGSNDPAAAPQEMGTSRIPPRPFLAPAAAAAADPLANTLGKTLGKTLADALKGGTEPP